MHFAAEADSEYALQRMEIAHAREHHSQVVIPEVNQGPALPSSLRQGHGSLPTSESNARDSGMHVGSNPAWEVALSHVMA